MIPPGPFPYVPPFRPAMPIMMPRSQFRPRIIYNNRARPKLPAPAVETSTSTASTTAATSTVVESTPMGEDRTQNTEDLGVKTETAKNCESDN